MYPLDLNNVRFRLHLPEGLVMVAVAEPGTVSGSYPAVLGERAAVLPTRCVGSRGPSVRVQMEERLAGAGQVWFPAAIGDLGWINVVEAVVVPGMSAAEADRLRREWGLDEFVVWDRTSLSRSNAEAVSNDPMGWLREWLAPDAVAIDHAYRSLGLRSPYVSLVEIQRAFDVALAEFGKGGSERARELEFAQLDLAQEFWRIRDARARLFDDAIRDQAQRAEADASAVRLRALNAAEADAHRAKVAEGEATTARHAQDVAAGWPDSWSPAQVLDFAQLGGSASQAANFAAGGWPVSEVIEAVKSSGSANALCPPEGSREHHARFGDCLEDLIAGAWPVAPSATQLSLKRAGRGRRERWFVVSVDDGVQVNGWRLRGEEWFQLYVGEASTLEAAVRETTSLHRVSAGMASAYILVDEDAATFLGWLRLPRVSAESRTEMTDDDVEVLGSDVWWDEGVLNGLTYQLLCWVDEQALVRVKANGRWHTLLVNGADDQLPGSEVAYYSWLSESGGGPISWDGGSSLTLIASGLIDDRTWGDIERERLLVALPPTDAGLVRLIADWVVSLEISVAAAFALESWPAATSANEKNGEDEGLTFGLFFDVSREVEDALRRRLGRVDFMYRTTREAMRHPRSARGRSLRIAIREAVDSGSIGGLLNGDWV